MKITQRNVMSVPDGKYAIGDNLLLVVRRNGTSRYFAFRYVFAGKRRELSLGRPSFRTLAAAKEEAARCQLLLTQGIDPKLERERANDDQNALDPTFEEFCKIAIPEIANVRRYRSKNTIPIYESKIRRFAFPFFGQKRLSQITADDVLASLQPIWETTNRTASMYRGFLEMIFTHARAKGLMKIQNPAVWKGNLDAFLPPETKVRNVQHRHAVSVDQAKFVVRESILRKSQGLKALFVIILTASREHEIVSLRWSECDFEEKIISIPPERRKDGRPFPHRIPMSKQVEALLQAMPRNGEFVFPMADDSTRPMWTRAPYKGMETMNPDFEWTVHGFRSTFRDWAAENGIPSDLAEKSLMHKTGNVVEQAYQRSDLLELRRPVMQQWADELISVAELQTLISESKFRFNS